MLLLLLLIVLLLLLLLLLLSGKRLLNSITPTITSGEASSRSLYHLEMGVAPGLATDHAHRKVVQQTGLRGSRPGSYARFERFAAAAAAASAAPTVI